MKRVITVTKIRMLIILFVLVPVIFLSPRASQFLICVTFMYVKCHTNVTPI